MASFQSQAFQTQGGDLGFSTFGNGGLSFQDFSTQDNGGYTQASRAIMMILPRVLAKTGSAW